MSVDDFSSASRQLAAPARRHDLDWLRVIAFGLLIFYHIGMFYVTWDWHVKSVHASAFLEPAMRLLNPWRLSLLFLISGVAMRFMTDKGALARLAGSRSLRLFIVIVFGMHVIVAPQSYFQLIESGEIQPGWWAFYREYLIGSGDYSITIPTWNHLWYVVYLFVYTLILIQMVPVLRPLARRFEQSRPPAWAVLLLPLVLFVVYRFTLTPYFPTTHNLVWDWANHAYSFTFLMIGYFIAKHEAVWRAIDRALPAALALSIGAAVILTPVWMVWDRIDENIWLLTPARLLRVAYAWWAIVALMGLARRYLNRPGPVLAYLSEGVFAYYILHQTIIVAASFWLTRQGLPAPLEFAQVMLATIAGCALGFEVIRRVPPLRPLFGLKLKRGARRTAQRTSPA